MSKTAPLLTALIMVSVVLAGCVSEGDSSETPATVDDTPHTIDLGDQGAINGLVVDDNYRPVQLKEDWGSQSPGDYQDQGFVLILETAQRFETNENGEFQAIPLKPGPYTIRVAADNHEAIDKKVQVVAGEYTEVTIEARREFSGGGLVLSQEHTLFMACFGSMYLFKIALAAVANNGCGDLSGDSSRFDFFTSYQEIAPDIRGLVTEMRAREDWRYSMTIRIVGDPCDYSAGYCYFDTVATEGDGDYLHSVLYPGLQKVAVGEYIEDGQPGYCAVGRDSECPEYAFTLAQTFQTGLFTGHPTDDYAAHTCGPTQPVRQAITDAGGFGGCNGVGLTLGVKAQFVQNVFLHEMPEEGIEDYCVLCEDADIPE